MRIFQRFFLSSLLIFFTLSLSLMARATTGQFVNGGFNDSGTFGNSFRD